MDETREKKRQLKRAYKKAKRKALGPWKVLCILCLVVSLVATPLYAVLHVFDNTVAAFVGGTFWQLENEDPGAQYFTSDFDTAEEMVDYGLELCEQVEAEGAALLLNNNNALPLAKGAAVSCFSTSSVNLVYGGTGSGNIDASSADTLKDALERLDSRSMRRFGTSTPKAPAASTCAWAAPASCPPVQRSTRLPGASTPRT